MASGIASRLRQQIHLSAGWREGDLQPLVRVAWLRYQFQRPHERYQLAGETERPIRQRQAEVALIPLLWLIECDAIGDPHITVSLAARVPEQAQLHRSRRLVQIPPNRPGHDLAGAVDRAVILHHDGHGAHVDPSIPWPARGALAPAHAAAPAR